VTLDIVPLERKHLEDAAILASARYAALRERVPSLPSRYENVDEILPMLSDLAGRAPGVAAIRDGRVAGYLVGFVLSEFHGQRSVYSPEWANGAYLEDSGRIYSDMYTHLCDRWLANGCFTHLVSTFANDLGGIKGWHWLGFGMATADAVRGLEPALGPTADVDVRRGGLGDTEQVMALLDGLSRHLSAAPTYLAFTESEDRQGHEAWVGDPTHALWLAFEGEEVIGCLKTGPASEDACTIIRDEGTTSIVGAFTREHARGKGIAAALLDRALEWARSEGYVRCAVDFEPMNVLAARFWLRHFQSVCYALVRKVDKRVAWAHARRDEKDIW
jgi:GNAT superfamily N-acetyltransferase